MNVSRLAIHILRGLSGLTQPATPGEFPPILASDEARRMTDWTLFGSRVVVTLDNCQQFEITVKEL